MARTVSSTIIASANAQTTTEVYLALLKFSHSSISDLRFVNNTEDITSNSLVYTAAPFSISLPPEGQDATPTMRVAIDNVDRSIIGDIRAVSGGSERIACDVLIVAASDPDTGIATYSGFEMVNVSYNAQSLSFDLSVNSLLTEPFPYDSFTPTNTPGIF